MEGTIKLPYASLVKALLLSRRNNSGQRVRVPEAVGSLLSEVIRSEVRLAAALSDPLQDSGRCLWDRRHHCQLSTLVAFGGDLLREAGITSVGSLVSLPIPIIRDLSCWRR